MCSMFLEYTFFPSIQLKFCIKNNKRYTPFSRSDDLSDRVTGIRFEEYYNGSHVSLAFCLDAHMCVVIRGYK